MRNVLITCLFLLGNLLCTTATHAQLGWKWGIEEPYQSFTVFAIATDTSGNIYTGGMGPIYGGGAFQFAVLKTDSSGKNIWTTAVTGTTQSAAVAVATDKSGDVYILGEYADTMCIIQRDTLRNPGKSAMYFLMKCSSATGNILWIENIANTSTSMLAFISTIGKLALDAAGNLYVSGAFVSKSVTFGTTTIFNTDTGGHSSDIFIAKYTLSGTPVWAKSFGGIDNEDAQDNRPIAFAVTEKGNIYITGTYASPMLNIGTTRLTDSLPLAYNKYEYFAKFDSSGNAIWAQRFDKHVWINSITADKNENVYITGAIDSIVILGADTLTDNNSSLVLLAKYSPSGTEMWARVSDTGNSNSYGTSISLDYCGNIWTNGPYELQISFDGHQIKTTDSLVIYSSLFLVEYDTLGNYKTIVPLNNATNGSTIISNQLCVNNKGDLYMSGSAEFDTVIIGPDTLTDVVLVDPLFIGKYKYDTISCFEYPADTTTKANLLTLGTSEITIYPNPATNECTIQSGIPFSTGSKAQLYDMAGRLISSYSLSGSSTVISLAAIAPGIYQCRITTSDNDVVVKKLVVMK